MNRLISVLAGALLVAGAAIAAGCGQKEFPPPGTTGSASQSAIAERERTPRPASPSASASRSPSRGPTSFTSPLYGYTVALPGGWTAKAATMFADDPLSTDETATDLIPVPDTDTTIGILAWDLGDGGYEAWAKAFHDDLAGHAPGGCDGGDPSTWASIPVGDRSGYLVQRCNNAVVVAPIGRRVYAFDWGHASFDEGSHLPESAFKTFLLGVRLPDATVAGTLLWSTPPAGP